MKCDVLIVGAGPAGLAASITTASMGLNTIIIEKNAEIGYPIKTSAFTFKEVIDSWSLPENVILQWCESFYINSAHSKREVEVNFGKKIGGYLDFRQFLIELSNKAVNKGSKIKLSTAGIEPILNEGIVEGAKTIKGEIIKSKIVIDCSGPAAIIGRKLNLVPKANEIETGIGVEYEMEQVYVRNQKAIDFYVGQKEIVPIGYGWVFPIAKDKARVGICTVYNAAEEIEEKNIDYWHKKFLSKDSPIYNQVKNAQLCEIHKGTYPLSGMLDKPYTNGFLMAGDSAAQASMLVGEGIRYAMEFGKCAGETAIESIRENNLSKDFLKRYISKCNDYLGEYFKVAIDLLQVPTDEYWESLIDAMIKYKNKNPELILKYLKTEMTYEDASKIFPTFSGKYLP
jgi:digeranylgeranylglycerophospholipid reductase